VSIRGENRGRGGELLSTLQIVDLSSNKIVRATDSESIQVIDWIGDKLIYVKAAIDKDKDDASRHRLVSYDFRMQSEIELARASYFNDASVAKGVVYFSPAKFSNKDASGFYSINPDSSGKFKIASKEIWNILRTSYDNLNVSVGQDWYALDLVSGNFSRADGAPSSLRSRVYYDSPDKTKSLWSEDRDGKGTLLVYEQNKKDRVITSRGGLRNPLRWLDDSHVVFRISNSSETADYVLSLDGGEAKKISDVTDVIGIDRWYIF
jgi:hypothetical protein